MMKLKKSMKTICAVLCMAMMTIMSVVPALAALPSDEYVENHSVIGVGSYYMDNGSYTYLIKISKGTPLSAITANCTTTGQISNLGETSIPHMTVEYQYTDSTSDCYLVKFTPCSGCSYGVWYSCTMKFYYDYNGVHCMATNTSNNSTTEGPGYTLNR